MKDWKDQLLDLKRSLLGKFFTEERKEKIKADQKVESKPGNIDFTPPASWFEEPQEDPRATKQRHPQRSTTNRSREIPHTDGVTPGPKSSDDRRHLAGILPSASGTRDSSVRMPQPAAESSKRPNQRVSDQVNRETGTVVKTRTARATSPRKADTHPPSRHLKPPEFSPHFGAVHRVHMPEWTNEGKSLQHPKHRDDGSPMVVRVGIDFGTAFTKVAIRVGRDLLPVDWSNVTGDESPGGRYVMPGLVYRTPKGEYHWRQLDGNYVRGNLKLPLIDTAGFDDCPTDTLAYLALIIRYARAFLYRHPEFGRRLAARSLRWELNVGCPTEPHERLEVVRRFQKIARIAWQLAGVNNLDEVTINATWRRNDSQAGLETDPGVIPEFVAQIASYLQSSQVNEGLHALVDVGAATLDVATFNVVLPSDRNISPRIPIFFSAIRPLGTHYLSHERHYRLGLELSWDDAAPVDPPERFADRHGRDRNEVDAIDAEFGKRVTDCIAEVIAKTRTDTRGYQMSSVWHQGLPTFVTGGGSSCALYQRAVDDVQHELKRRIESLDRFRIIKQDTLGVESERFGMEARGRLNVAIGLTEDAENIARIMPHRDIGPIIPTTRRFIDHTEIYGD